MDEPAAMTTDGRTARRDRNRELVLDAALDLFAEGHLFPSAPDVAERSGVSLRSVFRYYEDTEALLRAAMARHLERVGPLFVVEGLGEGAFEDRVKRYVTARLRLYAAVAPTARAGLVRAATNPIIAERFEGVRVRSREQLAAMFAPELRALPAGRRRAALAAADALFTFHGLDHLALHSGLGSRQLEDALRQALHALLGPRPAAG
ncbi:MAG TPA: TetR/AcrR family transcriptional regulator [Aquihabitans sp.]|jgi:AcrR family transcriptional regulator|nr:TetR/AcrR family transcriptional regulator [Aquihabitans sp.]